MALLLGQEAEGGEAEASVLTEIGHAFKYAAAKTGKVEVLHVTFSASGTGTKANLALQADEAGKPKEGVLAEGVVTSVTVGAHEIAVMAVEVTEGTVYWLSVQPQGGTCKYKQGATTSRSIASTKHAKISEVTAAQWGAAANKGPISIWATGTEGGGVLLPQCKTTLTIASKAGPIQTLAASLSAKVIIQGKTTALQTTLARCVSSISFRNAAVANQILSLSGSSKVVIGQNLTAKQAMTIAGSSKVTFAQKVTVKVTGGEAARIVAIFIFEDDED